MDAAHLKGPARRTRWEESFVSEPTPVAEAEMSSPPSLRAVLTPRSAAILAAVFLSQATMYLVVPFLALYFHEGLQLGLGVTGVLIGLPFLGSVLFGTGGGAAADRIGLLRAFVIGTLVSGVAIGSIAILRAPVAIGAVLFISGSVRPMATSSLQALANGSVSQDQRGTVQNAIYWVANLGVVLGLLVSAEILHGGLSPAPFAVLGTVNIVVGIIAYPILRERSAQPVQAGETNNRVTRQQEAKEAPPPSILSLARLVVADPALLLGALTMALVIFVEAQTSATVPLDLANRVANAGHLYGPLLAIDAVAVLALTPLAMHFLSKRRAIWVFAVGTVVSGMGLALGGTVDRTAVWVIGMVIYSVGEVLWAIKLNDLMGQLPRSENAGLYFSVIMTAQNLGAFVGASGGTFLFHSLGRDVLFPGLIIVALGSAFAFQGAVRALRVRTAEENVVGQTVIVGALAGAEIPEAVTPRPAEVRAEALLQGAAGFHAPSAAVDLSTFEIPAAPERVVFLPDLSQDEWESLLVRTETLEFHAGDTVVTQGSEERALYIVIRGILGVVLGTDGGERNLTVIPSGSVFGEQSFADGRPRSATIRALDDAEVRRFKWEAYLTLAEEQPVLAGRVMSGLARVLSERLRLTTEYASRRAG